MQVESVKNPVKNPASVESAWFPRLKHEYDGPLSNVAFNLNLRRYTQAFTNFDGVNVTTVHGGVLQLKRLNPVLKSQ